MYSKFSNIYEQLFPFRPGTYKFLRQCLPSSGPVLDVGCGTGHYSGRLSEDGCQVVGIDIDETMIARASEQYPGAIFLPLDMSGVEAAGNHFQGAFCLGNVLPHLETSKLNDFLAALFCILEEQGRWLVQTVNFDPIVAREKHCLPPIQLAEGNYIFQREYRNITRAKLAFHTSLSANGKEEFAGQVDLYPLQSKDIISLHENAGFSLLGHWADFTGKPFVSAHDSASVYLFERSGRKSG